LLEVVYLRKMSAGVAVVAAPAEIDVTTAGQLRALLLEAAAATGHSTVVVDLTGTEFCDSAGLHTLLRAHKRAVAGGGGLRLVVPPGGAVPRVLSQNGLDLLLPCFPSLAEALAPAPTRQAGLVANAGGPAAAEPGDEPGGGQIVTAHR
jgi:anti-anti-sigma factor